MNMGDLYLKFFAPTAFHSYNVGDWWVLVQGAYRPAFNDFDWHTIGPFATSEEAVANGKVQTKGTPYIFQIRDTEPK